MLEIKNVSYSYNNQSKIINKVNVEFEKGKMYVICGASGSGKTTFLSLIGGLEETKEGSIVFEGENIKQRGLEWYRKNIVSFVFQNYNLIDYLTAKENVMLTAKLDPITILLDLGISEEEAERNILQLSGGQQQRIAIARAIASQAPVILADEPTGNLDNNTAMEIIGILKKNAHDLNKCVVIVTHSMLIAKEADKVFWLENGKLVEELKNNE